MKGRLLSVISVLAALAILIGLAVMSYGLVAESYGSGPPHYGRTTNMDKWANPMPALVVINGLGVACAGALLWFGLRRRRGSPER